MNGQASENVLTEKEIGVQIEEAGRKAGVGFLDIDFLLILFFAIFIDIIDLLLALFVFLDLFTISWAISAAIDVVIFAIIGGWIYWRTGKIAKSKRKKIESLKKTIAKRGAQLEKQLAKGIKSPFRRMLARAGLGFLGEIAWLVGIIPFWTITVLLTLKEK